MKKWFFIFVFVLLAFVIGAQLRYSFFSGKTNITSNSAVLVYKNENKNINVTFTQEESAVLKKMLHNKWLGHDIPACGFNPEISIRFGEEIFLPALDGHNAIGEKNSELYFSISHSERKTMDTILKKYGATFPAL